MSVKHMEDLLEAPTEKQLIEIQKELNEDEEKFQHNLKLFKEWVRCQEYLPQNYVYRLECERIKVKRFDVLFSEENMLHIVLHGRLNKLNEAKEKFRNYFISKSKVYGPADFKLRFENAYQKQINNFGYFPLRKLTDTGYRVYLLYLKSPDYNLFDADLYFKSALPLRHLMYCREGRISGDFAILDGTHFGPQHCAKILTPFIIRQIGVLQNTYPVILKQIHFININPHIEKVLLIMRQFLKEKIRQRIVVHKKSYTELSKYFSLDILPEDYGGKEESKEVLWQKWKKFIFGYEEWFLNQFSNVNCSENIPVMDLENVLNEGSFRKLNID